LRAMFPQFSQGVAEGKPAQQDSEELFNSIAQSVQAALGASSIIPGTSWDSLLGLQMEETLTCTESAAEEPLVRSESANKLICNIQNSLTSGTSSNIDHMFAGIQLSLEGQVDKNAASLGRDAVWKRTQRIKSLPRYLCVHFMRFFWKATPDARDHQGVKCKIMRSVRFPDKLDVYPLCAPSLQVALKSNRDAAEARESAELSAKRNKPNDDAAPAPAAAATGAASADADARVDDEDEDAAALRAALAMSLEGTNAPAAVSSVFTGAGAKAGGSADTAANVFSAKGLPATFTGMYELHSLVTHQGRDADGGHYVGWVRQAPGSAKWWQYNDSVVTEATQADFLLLCGGGDAPVAYLAFYRYKQ
jgi:ubiquitin carboxyl-terminal hydrolase 14